MELDINTMAAMYEEKLFLPGIMLRLLSSLTLPLTLLDFSTDWFSSGMFQIINTIGYSQYSARDYSFSNSLTEANKSYYSYKGCTFRSSPNFEFRYDI